MSYVLQKKIKASIADKSMFELAKEFAYEYMDGINSRAIFPDKSDLENLKKFRECLPQSGSDEKSIISMLHKTGAPNTVAQTGGRYFGFVNGGALPVTLAVRWMTDVWDQNAVLYVASPIASVIEDVCEQWLVELFELPSETGMGLVGGSSDASLCALTAARNTILEQNGWNVYQNGLMGATSLRVVLSDEAHGTIFKALSILGIGTNNIVKVKSNSQGTISAHDLPKIDRNTILVLQAGNVDTGGFDQFQEICETAHQTNAWVHIDGAFGLWAKTSRKYKKLTEGIEYADSWSVDAHKTLNIPYDCGIVLCKSREALCRSMQANGSYILYSEKRDGMSYTTAMSRRARAFELWAAIKYLGAEGIGELVETLCDRARYFADRLSENGFHIINEVVFNQVLVTGRNDAETTDVLKSVQEDGICWCGQTQWKSRKAIRISVCSWATTESDIDLAINSFVKSLHYVRKGKGEDIRDRDRNPSNK